MLHKMLLSKKGFEMKKIVLFLGILALFIGCGDKEKGSEKVNIKKERVAIVSKGYQHEFWRTVEAGAKKASDELGIEMSFIGPQMESEIGKQVSMVENEILKKPTALLLAALDQNALRPVAEKIIKNGTTLVTFDSNINGGIETSFVATDNVGVGIKAALKMVELIGNKGVVGIIAHNAGTSTAIERLKGFVDEMEKYPEIKLLTVKYSEGDKLKALAITQDIVTANPDIKGIYGTNEGVTVGIGRAISEIGKNNLITVIGVDSSAEEIALLKEGAIDAMVVQDPFNMGYLAVKTAIDAAHGKRVEKRIDTGSMVITLKDLELEKVKKILYPFGKK